MSSLLSGAPAWRARLLAALPDIRLTLVIGQYAQAWHLKDEARASLTDTTLAWREYGPTMIPMPHPSPRG
jgi:uracil-DNA glycosylase